MFLQVLSAYVVGAIPTGYWLCKWLRGIDVTQYGSGNIGATNVGRALGKFYFFLVFLIDAGKAFGVLAVAAWLSGVPHNDPQFFVMAVALLVGNAHSVFMKFHGGKGVATTGGILAFLYPWNLVIIWAVCWLIILAIDRRAFVASFIAYFVAAGMCFLVVDWSWQHGLFWFFLGGWLVWRHWNNLKKLGAGDV